MNNNEEQYIIVDANDNEIDVVSRSEHEQHTYRVSALWITNSNGEVLLAQRSFSKKHSPGKWGPAVAGTVEEGETYLSNIIKETEEEIGLALGEDDLRLGSKENPSEYKDHSYFVQWYTYTTDIPSDMFKVAENEVEQVKWFSPEEFQRQYKQNPTDFVGGLSNNFKLVNT